MRQCTKCGKNAVITEGLGDGKIRLTCQSCSYSVVVDERGRQLLTDDLPAPIQCHLILE